MILTDELLRLENIGCLNDRGLPLVEDVSFVLNTGSILWVTGPAGSGKTTLLEVTIKERRPDVGKLFFHQQPLWGRGCIKRSQLRRQIGVIFQEDYLLAEHTVFENAAAALQLTGCPRSVLLDRTYRALAEVGLTAKAEQGVHLLSSSEKRLLSLARVLAKMAPLVIADLNTCEVDLKVIAPRLETLASYGCGVLIFSKQRSQETPKAPVTAELMLR
jgi:cell division transport system ATP-binding protein